MGPFGGSDGSITVGVLGGTTPYSYLWSGSPGQTTAISTGLVPGTYLVTVTDANGCNTLASALITQPPLLTHTILLVVDVSCTGACDGTATVVASGGAPGYAYVWSTVAFQ